MRGTVISRGRVVAELPGGGAGARERGCDLAGIEGRDRAVALDHRQRQRSGGACLLSTTCSGFHDLDPNMLLLEATFSAPRRKAVKGQN